MKQTVQTQTPYSVDTSSTDTLYLFIYPLLMPDGLIKIIVIPYLKNEQSKAISDNRDRLTKRGKLSYNYDNNGSLTTITHTDNGLQRSFIYNLENRLIQVKDGQGQSISSYQYDPFGRRISKTVGTVTIYYFYSAEGLVAEMSASGQVTTQYGYRPDGTWGTNPLYIKQKGYTGYYQNDHLGTPQQIISSSGQILWNANYSAFGQASVSTNVITNNLRLAGQYYDQETNLHYNYFRYYDPTVGRYVTSDPIGLEGGLNTYLYANANPVKYIDPLGLNPVLKKLIKNIKIDGPRPSKKGDGTGSLFQIRYKKKPVFRVDLHPIDQVDRTPVPHFHLAPDMKKHREFLDFLKEPIKKGIQQCLK